MEEYDGTELLKSMIEHVAKIVEISSCFSFEGRPFEVNDNTFESPSLSLSTEPNRVLVDNDSRPG